MSLEDTEDVCLAACSTPVLHHLIDLWGFVPSSFLSSPSLSLVPPKRCGERSWMLAPWFLSHEDLPHVAVKEGLGCPDPSRRSRFLGLTRLSNCNHISLANPRGSGTCSLPKKSWIEKEKTATVQTLLMTHFFSLIADFQFPSECVRVCVRVMMAVAHFPEPRKGQETSNFGLASENITACLWCGVWSLQTPDFTPVFLFHGPCTFCAYTLSRFKMCFP